MSDLVVQAVVVHTLVANFVDKNIPLLTITIAVVAVGSSAASDVVAVVPTRPPEGPLDS